MVSVLLVAFLVQFGLHLVNAIGGQKINDLLWFLYTRLPTEHARNERDLLKLKNDVVRLYKEMSATSAQDNFAQWARLRREHDKTKDKYEKMSSAQRDFRSTFDRILGGLRFLFTQGVNFFLNTWYSKEPMFWLPHGWFPYPIEWILSCPRAPLGSISVNVWGVACGTVIGLVSEALRASIQATKAQGQSEVKAKEQPMKMSSGTNRPDEKKEL